MQEDATCVYNGIVGEYTQVPGKCPYCDAHLVFRNNSIVLTPYPSKHQYTCKRCGKVWSAFNDSDAVKKEDSPMHTEKQTTPLNAVWYDTRTVTTQAYSIGDNYAEPFYRTGWVCPKCGRVLSPDTTACPCSEPGKTTVTTTETTPYWESLPKTYSSNLNDYLDELNKQSERELTEEEKKELWRKFYCSAIQNTNN